MNSESAFANKVSLHRTVHKEQIVSYQTISPIDIQPLVDILRIQLHYVDLIDFLNPLLRALHTRVKEKITGG